MSITGTDEREPLKLREKAYDAFTQHLLAGAPCPPPPNDDCTAALLIPANGVVVMDNTSATTAANDPPFSCRLAGSGQGVGTLWFKFEATDTSVRIDTCTSAAPVTDTLVAVYASTASCPFLVTDEIGCDEDSCGQLSRLCVSGLTPGTTYFIQVASQDDASRGLVSVQLMSPCPQ